MSKPIVINLIGGPATGKTVLAADIFSVMKKSGAKVELAAEWIKAPVYEGRLSVIKDQIYVLGKQHRNISRVIGHVDYVICDSPLLLCPIYAAEDYYPNFTALTLDVWNQYDNITLFLDRTPDWVYQTEGRYQDLEGAKEVDLKILNFLRAHEIPFSRVPPNRSQITFDFIRKYILNREQGVKAA